MKIKNIFKSMNGFSLVEVLAAMAVLGVLSTVIMKLMDNANKSAKTIEAKDEISQLQREISDLLSNPNNCQATLGQRTVGSSVPLVYHMVNGVPAVKITPSTAASTKATVQSISVKEILPNGDGSQALGTLDVYFQKPGNALGGREIKKEIKFNANLCAKDLISGDDNSDILGNCSGPGRKLIQGPYDWNNKKWAVCQDCNSAASNPIMTCQSTGGGVDVGNISQLSCASLGGTFDDDTSRCLFLGLTLEQLIESKVDPNNFVNLTPPTCPPGGTYSLAVDDDKKIKMNCTAPPACTGCTAYGGWSLLAKGCSSGHGGIEPCRTTCSYVRSCTNKTPAGCVGSVSDNSSGAKTYYESMGGNKYMLCKNADDGPCPAASVFGI